ncbi:MAG: DUF374 domain-containing protein [Chlorobiaceae bacterium]|nr:DUF374 domain-containing protein [Chlorobiaceae bacterium]
MPIVKNILWNAGTRLLPPLLKLLFSSLRLKIVSPEGGHPGTEHGIIFAFWHGKMVTGWLLVRRLLPDIRPSAVVSLSEDGQILSETLERLGFRLIRGSSSRGREDVKTGMLESLRNRGVIAITPDGPRGPLHRFKYGTLRIASEHQVPILFADITHERYRVLKSWDRFEIPMPFSRTTVYLHSIRVPAFTSEEALHEFARKLSEHFGHASR